MAKVASRLRSWLRDRVRFGDDDVPLVGLDDEGQRADPSENKKMHRELSADAGSFMTLRSEAGRPRSEDYFQAPPLNEDSDRW